MATNWNQPPAAIVTDLLADKNTKFSSTASSFAFKNVGPNTQANATSKNTQITVYPTDTTKYSGEVIATYRRVEFPAFMNKKTGSPTPTVSWGQQTGQTLVAASTTKAQLVSLINTLFGLQLSTTDYATLTATLDGGFVNIAITFADANLVFVPSVSATLRLDQTTPTSAIITAPDLDGLDLPA